MGKKFFSDLDSYQGFVSSWVTEQGNPARVESVKPMFSAQMDRIENRMTEEKFKLDALKELMADVLEASSALLRLHQETRSWDDSDLVDRVDAALKRALTVVIGLYPKLDLATQTGHLNRSFNVEAGSKLEILTKVIFLCQGWNAFRKSEVPKKEPFEAVLQQGDQVGSILPPETDEDDFDDDTLAAFAPTLLRFAMVAEESGNSWLADIFEKLSR
jgi:hypothetical protein